MRHCIRKHWSFLTIIGLAATYLSMPIYRDWISPEADESQQKCWKSNSSKDPRNIERPRYGQVITIQLTDNGQYVDRCQETDAFYELNWNRTLGHRDFNAKVNPAAQALPKFVVVYVHGWKNDARKDAGNYPEFNSLIKKLQEEYKSKQVVGIYLSWFARTPFLEDLTFWNRKRAADRIAQSGTPTKIISAFEAILAKDNDKQNQLVVIGHSLGARIAFSATAQNLLHAVERAHPGRANQSYDLVRGSADAVILLNPAFEASFFTAINSLFRFEEQFRSDQAPVLISVSTDNDRTTSLYFRIGQWLDWGTTLERTTLGNYEPYMTHTLRETSHDECLGPSGTNEEFSNRFYLSGLCSAPLPRRTRQPNNPFLIVKTNSDIIDGHSDIWNQKLSNWIFELIKELGKRHESTNKTIE